MTGKVKSFNRFRGYGFIHVDGRDLFFHYSSIMMEGYKKVRPGKTVEFDVLETDRGPRAENVRIITLDT